MNVVIKLLSLLIVFTSLIGASNDNFVHVTLDKKIAILKQVTEIFLIVLHQEDYHVIVDQLSLFKQYETLLVCIVELPEEALDTHTALCFAKALAKGANIYRRIANERSLKQALYYHQKALSMRKKHLDSYAFEIAHSLVDLGATYNESKGHENNIKAIECYNESLFIYEKNNDVCFVASTLHKLGNAYRDLDENNINLAIDCLNQALLIYKTLPNGEFVRQEKAKVFFNQGINYHHRDTKENIEKAITYLYKAKELFELENDNARSAMVLSYLGDLYRCLGNDHNETALECLNEALYKQKKLFDGEHFEIAVTLFTLGMVYHDASGNDNLAIAITHFEDALVMQRKLLHEKHQHSARTLYYLGLSYVKNGKIDSGVVLIQEALDIFKTLPINHYYIKTAQKTFEQLHILLMPYDSEEVKIILATIETWLRYFTIAYQRQK